jgi:hypothetical protein
VAGHWRGRVLILGLPLPLDVGEGRFVFLGDAEQGFDLVIVSDNRARKGFHRSR